MANRVPEVAALDVFVHEPGQLAVQVSIEQRDDVGVLSLPADAGDDVPFMEQIALTLFQVMEEFHGANHAELRLRGEPDLAEAAAGEVPIKHPARPARQRSARLEVRQVRRQQFRYVLGASQREVGGD